MAVNAGATIDDETGEMNVKEDTTIVAAHLFLRVQFFGFSGSSGPFHVTCQGYTISHAMCKIMHSDSVLMSTDQVWILDRSCSLSLLQRRHYSFQVSLIDDTHSLLVDLIPTLLPCLFVIFLSDLLREVGLGRRAIILMLNVVVYMV